MIFKRIINTFFSIPRSWLQYWSYIMIMIEIEILVNILRSLFFKTVAVWKVSKFRVFSGPYFPLFGLNTGNYGPKNLWIWSHLLQKSLMENLIFCAVFDICFCVIFGCCEQSFDFMTGLGIKLWLHQIFRFT